MSPNENRILSANTTEMDNTLKRNRIINDGSINAKEQKTVRKDESIEVKVEYVPRIRWLDLSAQIFVHFGGLYGLYLVFTQAKLLTILWSKTNSP